MRPSLMSRLVTALCELSPIGTLLVIS